MEELLRNSKTWEVVVDCKGVSMENVQINFSPKNNRKPFPEHDKEIEKLWQEKKKKNDRFFNQSKFRFADASISGSNILLDVGITDYKETCCTNLLPSSDHIATHGEEHHGNRHACFGNALGVGSVVVTLDNHVILQKRADWLGESPGCLDTPGGHAEPDELLQRTGSKRCEVFCCSSSDVAYELFHSMIREVRDEVNVPESSLSWPLLLGVNRNKKYGGKPGLIFYLRCALNKDEVERLYLQGGPETDESTEIRFMPSSKLLSADRKEFLSFTSNMTPLGQLALLLYRLHHALLL